MPDDYEDKPSKSQVKRELDALKSLAARLVDAPEDQLGRLTDPALAEAIATCRKIRRGSARKRQIQYIGKLLRVQRNLEEATDILDRLDASSRAHAQAFHRLEQWRERLISEDDEVMAEIIAACPEVDRQHLRQLVRNAIDERRREEVPPVHYRKLFQYLKEIAGAN